MFYVEDRKKTTLEPLLWKNIDKKSTIHSDEAYSSLNDYILKHETVCHAMNFIDPDTKANTQLINTTISSRCVLFYLSI